MRYCVGHNYTAFLQIILKYVKKRISKLSWRYFLPYLLILSDLYAHFLPVVKFALADSNNNKQLARFPPLEVYTHWDLYF